MNKILETIDFEIYKLNEKYKMDYAYSDPRTNETLVALTTLESLRGQLEPLVSQENGGQKMKLPDTINKIIPKLQESLKQIEIQQEIIKKLLELYKNTYETDSHFSG